MTGSCEGGDGRDSTTIPPGVSPGPLVLRAAFTHGVVAKGCYYPPGRLVVTGLVAAAALVALWRHRTWPDRSWVIALAAAALALWALLRTIPAGGTAQPVAAAVTLGCVVAVLFVVGWSRGRGGGVR